LSKARGPRLSIVLVAFRSALLLREGNGNGPSVAIADHRSGRRESGERVADALVPDAELVPEVSAAERPAGALEGLDETSFQIARWIFLGRLRAREGEVNARRVFGDELETERVRGRGRPLLDREEESLLLAADVEERIGPCEEVSAASKG